MHPKADEFILDVRRAARWELRPTVAVDSKFLDPDAAAGAIQKAAIWLTPKTVKEYDSDAFSAWPGEAQSELRGAVDDFRSAASVVPADAPATVPQLRDGVRAFARLKEAVRKLTLSEWLPAASELTRQVESWAKQAGWATRREAKALNETLLGDYALDRLYFYAEGNLFVLDPLARFVAGGALGAFDLSIQPSFFVTSVYRDQSGAWLVEVDDPQAAQGKNKEPLTAEALKRALAGLRALL